MKHPYHCPRCIHSVGHLHVCRDCHSRKVSGTYIEKGRVRVKRFQVGLPSRFMEYTSAEDRAVDTLSMEQLAVLWGREFVERYFTEEGKA